MRPVAEREVLTIAEMQEVTREFRSDAGVVQALRSITLRIQPREFVALREVRLGSL